MKNLILLLVMLIPFSLFAQEIVEVSHAAANAQADFWMNKISSNSELRSQMMDLMIEKTEGSQEEMQKLVNSMKSNPGMNKLIMVSHSGKSKNKNNNLQKPMMMKDSVRIKKMTTAKPVLRN